MREVKIPKDLKADKSEQDKPVGKDEASATYIMPTSWTSISPA